jgi:hypothetical protein
MGKYGLEVFSKEMGLGQTQDARARPTNWTIMYVNL